MAKWIFASLVLGVNVFQDAVDQVAFRTGVSETGSSYGGALDAIMLNLVQLGAGKWILLIELIIVVIYCVLSIFRRANESLLRELGILLLITMIPFIWFALLSNHSIIHAGSISYRTLTVSLFALSSGVALIVSSLYERRTGFQKNFD